MAYFVPNLGTVGRSNIIREMSFVTAKLVWLVKFLCAGRGNYVALIRYSLG